MWKANFSAHEQIIDIGYDEPLTPLELRTAIFAAMQLTVEHRCLHILADCSRLTNGVALVELQELVEQLEHHGRPPEHREAIITTTSPTGREALLFYEQQCKALGYAVRLFPSRDAGLAWLRG